MPGSFKIAAVQAAPVFLDLGATVTKACRLIEKAADGGAKIIAFSEAFVPGYPLWVWFIPPGKTHPLRALYSELHANSMSIPGPEAKLLAEEGILYAEVEPHELVGPRWQVDTAGHYARPDVFDLGVRREPRPLITELNDEGGAGE